MNLLPPTNSPAKMPAEAADREHASTISFAGDAEIPIEIRARQKLHQREPDGRQRRHDVAIEPAGNGQHLPGQERRQHDDDAQQRTGVSHGRAARVCGSGRPISAIARPFPSSTKNTTLTRMTKQIAA